MEKRDSIKEALNYASLHSNKRVILNVRSEVIQNARKLGIIEDIDLIRKNGVNLIIVHDNPMAEPQKWYKLKTFVQEIDPKNRKLLLNTLNLNLIPVIRYNEETNGKIGIDKASALIANDLKAEKIVFITERDGLFDEQNKLIREISVREAENLLNRNNFITGRMKKILESSIFACDHNVDRVHIISGFRSGSLLEELYTCEGIGTMVYERKGYHDIRWASEKDTQNILYVIEKSVGGSTDFNQIENNIHNFIVFTVDKKIYGCCQILEKKQQSALEISCFTVSNEFNEAEVMQEMLNFIISYAQKREINYLFIVLQHNSVTLGLYPWFSDLGFRKGELSNGKQIKKGWMCKIS